MSISVIPVLNRSDNVSEINYMDIPWHKCKSSTSSNSKVREAHLKMCLFTGQPCDWTLVGTWPALLTCCLFWKSVRPGTYFILSPFCLFHVIFNSDGTLFFIWERAWSEHVWGVLSVHPSVSFFLLNDWMDFDEISIGSLH
jgi:hypothetical protein